MTCRKRDHSEKPTKNCEKPPVQRGPFGREIFKIAWCHAIFPKQGLKKSVYMKYTVSRLKVLNVSLRGFPQSGFQKKTLDHQTQWLPLPSSPGRSSAEDSEDKERTLGGSEWSAVGIHLGTESGLMFLCFFSLATILLRLKKIKDSGEFFLNTCCNLDRPTWTWWLQNVGKVFLFAFFFVLGEIIILQQSVKAVACCQYHQEIAPIPLLLVKG